MIETKMQPAVLPPWRGGPGALASSLLILFLLFGAPLPVAASSPDASCGRLLEKICANLMASGRVEAIMAGSNELIVAYESEPIPAYGAELMVFAPAGSADAAGGAFRGVIKVAEAAGHLNRALVDDGSFSDFKVGDRVGLPQPVKLFLTPVRNLTPYPGLENQFATALAARLPRLPGILFFSLPGSNQTTIDYLLQQCRQEGRYGLILQPGISLVNGKLRFEMRSISLYNGRSLQPFTDDLKPAPLFGGR